MPLNHPSETNNLRTWIYSFNYLFEKLGNIETFKKGIVYGKDMAYVGANHRTLETVKMEDLNRVCPDCGSTNIDYSNEEFFCKKCGLVLD